MASTISSEAAMRRCLLVVAKAAGGSELRQLLDGAGGRLELRVLAPAFVRSRLQFLASDVDDGIRQARDRLERSLAEIEADGVLAAEGEVGEADPLLAVESALVTFAADEIVIVPSDGRGHWAERRLLERAGARFQVPVRAL